MRLSGHRVSLDEPLVAHRPFEIHAENHPDRIALTCGDTVLTYRELNERANRLAHHLISAGVGEGCVVGVCLDRSAELMVAILATLKSGAAYVPLDTTYPGERLRLMTSQLADIRLVVVVSRDTAPLLAETTADLLELEAIEPGLRSLPATNPVVEISGESIYYVVFTSGSTGTPKATAVRHQGWYNLLNWVVRRFDLDHGSSNLMVSSFGFDISQRSLMTALFCGATQHLLPSRTFDAMMANRLITTLGVRTLHCAPSTLYLIVERDLAGKGAKIDSLDYVFVGGEPLNAGRVAEWATRPDNTCKLVNVYGVAECTDVSTAHLLADYARYASTGVPIGTAIDNVDVCLLDDGLHPVGAGEVGELCVSGIGVGAGYLNSATLNEERFVKVDLDGELVELYRTGDLAFVAEDGVLMCVGRVDAQIKIRGMRIDLGDVETAIRATKLVGDAAVVAHRNDGTGETELVALVIPSGADFDENVLRTRLRAALPANMVPASFVATSAFPLNPNGKIDRKALAATIS